MLHQAAFFLSGAAPSGRLCRMPFPCGIASLYISPKGGAVRRTGMKNGHSSSLGGLKNKLPGRTENFKNNAPDHVLVIRGLKIQSKTSQSIEFKPKIKDFSLSRNALFSKNSKAVEKAENINFQKIA